MDVNNNAWYFTGEIDYKKIPLIQKCKNIIVKCSVTTNFEVDNIISYLHNICSSGEMKTLDLREFYLPSGIYSIGYCSNIEKIILPQGESRISYCKNLKEIVLPQNSLLNITETNHNISLTKFVVEYGHKYYCVKNDALYSKDGRTLLLFPTNKICNYKLEESTEFIHENAFEGSLLKSISLNRNLKNIGKHAFKNSRIEKLYFNQSECELDEFVFEGCSRLHDIMIPAYWKTIKKGTFSKCYNIKYINLPKSLTTIEKEAFLNCSKLKVVTGGMGLLYIKERAFCGCINLSDICLKSIQEIESCAFKQCSIHNLIIRKGAKIDWGAFGYSSIKNVYVNSESSNLNENAFYNSVVDNFILPVNYINPQFIKIPWEQQSVFVGFICFLYEDNGIHYGLIRSEKRTFVRFKYKPQEEKFEIGNVVTYEYKKRYSKHFNGNNIVYTLDNANQGFNVLNLNYKPENKDKDSSEILLEYIKNDYWYKQGHKSKNYILSNEIISEYFKKKDYIGLQRKISAYVQQYDIKKACEQYFVTIEEDFRYRVGRDDYYSCCEVGKIEKYSTDTYIQKILPKYGKCLYEDKGYMAADKMAIDTTGYKEEASIKQIQIRNNALKYYNPICHEHELYEEILSDYISEQKENEYLLEKLFHYNTLVNYGKSYFSHDDLEKVRMDFMSFASHIL